MQGGVVNQPGTESEIESRRDLDTVRCAHIHGAGDGDVAAGAILIGGRRLGIGSAVHCRKRCHVHRVRTLHRRQSESGADESGKDGTDELHAHSLDGRRYRP